MRCNKFCGMATHVNEELTIFNLFLWYGQTIRSIIIEQAIDLR
jgi:hypothetical protein